MLNHMVSNPPMEIFRIRRSRLRQLIQDQYNGNQAEFSRDTKIKPPQVNRWLSQSASDVRNITERSARKIETAAKMPFGWLDHDISKSHEYAAHQPEAPRYDVKLAKKSLRETRIEEITKLLSSMDDYGLVAMLEKAKDVARDYPIIKQTPASSA